MDGKGVHVIGIIDFEVLKLFKLLLSNKKVQFVVGYILHHNTTSITPGQDFVSIQHIDRSC